MNNDEKLKEQMKSAPVPDELRPENIKIMLDNEASKKKRSGIKLAGRIAAAAAACTVRARGSRQGRRSQDIVCGLHRDTDHSFPHARQPAVLRENRLLGQGAREPS